MFVELLTYCFCLWQYVTIDPEFGNLLLWKQNLSNVFPSQMIEKTNHGHLSVGQSLKILLNHLI